MLITIVGSTHTGRTESAVRLLRPNKQNIVITSDGDFRDVLSRVHANWNQCSEILRNTTIVNTQVKDIANNIIDEFCSESSKTDVLVIDMANIILNDTHEMKSLVSKLTKFVGENPKKNVILVVHTKQIIK